MKILAMYLPQFHRVKENDEWWGEGFTEWTAVRDAEIYFDGQVQPRKPLNDNYYNLLDKNTFIWQAELMHEYGIHGMVFYHYWFKDGRKILEKPAENLLKWTDVDMPFCFSWANETWARSWSHIREKNAWSTKLDSELQFDKDNAILLEQQYGDYLAWEQHFYYLLDFFKDKRYIKVDGKPLFIIYKPNDISCLSKMIACWRSLARKSGFPDIYIIGVNAGTRKCLDADLKQEPQSSIRSTKRTQLISSETIWKHILSEYIPKEYTTYLCGFPGYDDTPRRGQGGCALSRISTKEFEDYMTKLFSKSLALGNEFVFINAWNEWGEGMYLEPDELDGYAKLQAIKNAFLRSKKEHFDLKKNEQDSQIQNHLILRYQSYWQLFDKWLEVLENNNKISTYFTMHGYKHIAVYGLGLLGRHLLKQIETSDVEVDFGIDIRGSDVRQQFPVLTLEQDIPRTQVIVVTVTYDFEQIYDELCKKVTCPIISLSEIIEWALLNNGLD